MTPYKDWIVISKNAKGLADNIEYFSKHKKEANRLVEKAHKWAQGQTWEKMTNDYLKLWEM